MMLVWTLLAGGSGAMAVTADAAIYWGSYVDGSHYGYGTAPWDARSIDRFEANAGKRMSIMHYGQPWYWTSRGGYQRFQRDTAEKVRLRGTIPMITWTSEDLDRDGSTDQPNFQLRDIIDGRHDAYIRQWARDAKSWGYPLFVRMNHEMNGNWYNWSEVRNGNSRGQFVVMWRRVVDLFRQEGASNVTWVWSPNRTWASAPLTLASVYPGGSYVDWVGVSGYNWGTNPAKPNNSWQSFDAVFKESYDSLRALAPGKPIMVSETASSEYGGSKAGWIKDALQAQLPVDYPQVKAFVWFNWNCPATNGRMDWVIESSSTARGAFAAGIASSHYASNTFGGLPKLQKVQPIGAGATGSNTVRNASFEWTGGTPWYAPWTTRNDLGASFSQDSTTYAAGARSLKIYLPRTSSAPWAVQMRQGGLGLQSGGSYVLSLSIKASTARRIGVVLQAGASPWTSYVEREASVGTAWARYTYAFTAPVTDAAAMLSLNVAGGTGNVWVDDVSLIRR